MLRTIAIRCTAGRGLHTSLATRINPQQVEEIKIPVPWGHIAGKWWGSTSEQPVVALHGLYDNAASFDLLNPHLNISVLALDLPGHGKSSHFPMGVMWSYTHVLSALRYLLKQFFKWPTTSLMGHSYGSTLALSYAGLYPKETSVLINIDCARSANAASYDETIKTNRRNTERTFALETGNPVNPSLKPITFEDAVRKMMKSRRFALTQPQTELIAARSLSNIGLGQYIFNEDLRMTVPSIGRNSQSGFDTLAGNVRCSVLNVSATDGIHIGESMAVIRSHMDTMKKNCPLVVSKIVSGGHHIHMDDPKTVARAINEFMCLAKSHISNSEQVKN